MRGSRITFCFLIFAWRLSCDAQPVAAINDLLKPIVSKSAADPNVGGWNWEINRNGGYLLRKQMDVTGDGRPEVFVASTLESNKHTHSWTVFDVAEDGTMRPYNRTLENSFAWPVTEGQSTSLLYVAPPDQERLRLSEEKSLPMYRYTFAYPEIKETISYVSEKEKAELFPAEPSRQSKLQAILLADYMTKPQLKWSDVIEWEIDSNGRVFRPEDKERAAENTAFTPQVALARLGVTPASGDPKGQSQQKPESAEPLESKSNETKIRGPNIEATSSIRWLGGGAVLIVASTGLMWLVLKNRRR